MSTHYDDPNGDVLARALRAEAQRIVPAGDGLTQIRDRIEQRRSRFRWLIPSASIVTAAALAGGAFGIYSLSSGGNSLTTQRPAHSAPAGSGTTSASASPTKSGAPQPSGVVSIAPVWPYTSASDAASWRSSDNSPWHLDPVGTAELFLKMHGYPIGNVVVVKNTATGQRSGDVTLGRTPPNGPTVAFATFQLARWGSGNDAPWEITGVTSAGATLDAPSYDATVSSPVTVRYTLDGGVEDNVTVSVYDNTARVGSTATVTGGGQHTTSLSLAAPAGSTGYVLVADSQNGSGVSVLQRLLVVPVRFAKPAVSASGPAQQYPPYFVAVKDGRLAVFYAKGGGFARWLTGAAHSASQPQLDAAHSWVYYLQDDRYLMRVKITGGAPQSVVHAEYVVRTFAIGGANDELQASVITSQDAATGNQHTSLQWSNAKTGASGAIPMPNPPVAEQLAWAPDGRHLAATLRTGSAWNVVVYDTATAKTWSDGVAIPCPGGQNCSAPSYDSAGNLYFITGTGATTYQLKQWTGTAVKQVSTWNLQAQADPETATVDITPDAEAAIVGTSSGEVYRIEHGKATLVPTQAASPTW
jgi:hypothetical protein